MTGWRDRAECRGLDPALFVPDVGTDPRPALAVCERCPVTGDCLAELLDEPLVVAGGYTAAQRVALRRGLPVPPPVPGLQMKSCRECGEEFEPGHGNERYCSPDCRATGYAKRVKEANVRRPDRHRLAGPGQAWCRVCDVPLTVDNARRYCNRWVGTCRDCERDGTAVRAARARAAVSA